jgi:hypothetical protein
VVKDMQHTGAEYICHGSLPVDDNLLSCFAQVLRGGWDLMISPIIEAYIDADIDMHAENHTFFLSPSVVNILRRLNGKSAAWKERVKEIHGELSRDF